MTHADRDGSERELAAYLAADKAEPRRASCGARVCSVDYTHGPHVHHPAGMVTLTRTEPAPDADRENTYAEAIDEFFDGADADFVTDIARAVIPLADREQATLLARIAKLEAEAGQLRGQVYAEQIRIDNHRLYEGDLRKSLADERAKVARVEALRENLAGYGPGTPMENVMGKQSVTIETLLGMLDAALAGDA